jgi:hypothetical protein
LEQKTKEQQRKNNSYTLPYKYRFSIACMHLLMRLLDKIYEGKDIWGDDEAWWDTQ